MTASQYERVERLEIPDHDKTLIKNLHVDHDYAHKLSTTNVSKMFTHLPIQCWVLIDIVKMYCYCFRGHLFFIKKV